MSVAAIPPQILQFLNNADAPNAGGSILTQAGGVNAATYQDAAGTVPLPNPIPLNSRGEVSNASGLSSQLFLTVGTAYTFTMFDAKGNRMNQATYLAAAVPQGSTGASLHPQTAAENAAGVIPVSIQYPPYTALRYLSASQIADALAGTLTQDVGPALARAQVPHQTLVFPAGQYLIGSNLTLSGKFLPQSGALLWVNAGVTLTLNAAFALNTAQICVSGPGTVAFGQEASSDGWRPEWFGGKPSQIDPTGSMTAGSPRLTVSSALDLEFGAGIAVFGAGAAPATPTGFNLVNRAGSGTNYTVQVAAVSANSGISAATRSTSCASGARPNITASWNAVPNAVLYLVYVGGKLVGATHGTSYPVSSTAVSGILFNGCPANAPAAASGGWMTSLVKGIAGTIVTLNDNAINTTTAQRVRLDATLGLQRCLVAADSAYGFGSLSAGVLGARTTSIVLNSGIYNITNTLIARGMFTIIGQGGNWIYGSVIYKNQIYANAFLVEGSSKDSVSMGAVFDQWQMSEANIAYPFTPAASDYYMRFLGYNGRSFTQPNSIYFLPGMRYNCINCIWTSHGDDWQIEGTSDGGVNFFHQQLDAGVPPAAQFTDALFRLNAYQCQSVCIYLSSANGVVISGGRYDYLVPPGGGGGGSAASVIIQLAPAAGSAVSNISITGNSFLSTRTVLNAGQSSGVVFTGNTVGGLAGTGLVLSAVHDYVISSNTFNFQAGQGYSVIAFNPASSNTGVNICDNVFDLSNTTKGYAITTANSAGNNTVLTASKVTHNVVTGAPVSARLIDWIDLASEMETSGVYTLSGSYPTNHPIGTLSAAQAHSSAIIDLRWSTAIVKTGVSSGEETGYCSILVVQAGGTSAAATSSVVAPVAARMEYNGGSVGASPTTTYTVTAAPTSAPGNAPGTMTLSVTCGAAGGAMAAPETVSTTLTLSTRGSMSTLGTGTFALKLA